MIENKPHQIRMYNEYILQQSVRYELKNSLTHAQWVEFIKYQSHRHSMELYACNAAG